MPNPQITGKYSLNGLLEASIMGFEVRGKCVHPSLMEPGVEIP